MRQRMQALFALICLLLQPVTPSAQNVTPSAQPASALAAPPTLSVGAPTQATPTSLSGEEQPTSSLALVPPVKDEDQLVALWRVREKAAEDGDLDQADRAFQQVKGHCGDLGISRHDAFAYSLILEARQLSAVKRDFVRADVVFGQARQLAPGLPEIDEAIAVRVLDERPYYLHKYVVSKMRGIVARLSDFQRRSLLLADTLLSLFLVLTAVALVFVVTQSIRHGLAIYHDLGSVFPALMKFLVLGVSLAIAALPLYFGFGPYLLAFPLLVVFFAYQRPSERVLSVLTVAYLAALPWTLRAVDRISEAGTGATQALFKLGTDPFAHGAAEAVGAELSHDPDDWQGAMVLGTAHKRRAKLSSAIELLRRAEAAAPAQTASMGLVKNNLANALFATGRHQSAEALYKEAAVLLPRQPEPAFNLSRVYTRTGRIDDAKGQFARASALDSDRVAAWNDQLDLNLNRYVIDLALPSSALTIRELHDVLAKTVLASKAWSLIAGPVPEVAAPVLAAVSALAFLTILVSRRRIRVRVPCSRCARAADQRLTERASAALCEQCHSLFVRNIPVDRRVRFEKDEQIARWRAVRIWGTRLSGLIGPGVAAFVTGSPLRGACGVALAGFLVIRILFPEGLLYEPLSTEPQGPLGFQVCVGALVVVWLLGVFSGVRRSGEVG